MKRLGNWLFRNRQTGEITIGQFPNLPLWIFLGALVLRAVLSGTARTVAAGVGMLALAWWAIDEIVRGVNPWRRILGATVLVFGVVAALVR